MKDLTGQQIGKYHIIKKQYNPSVKHAPNSYWLVEVDGKQKLMRYDNIITYGKYSERQIEQAKKIKEKKEYTPKQLILKYIQAKDDISLGAVMLCSSLDIINTMEQLRRVYPKTYFSSLHKYIEEYMNTPRYEK